MKHRVLFVDDDPTVLDSLRRALRRERLSWDMEFLDCAQTALQRLLECEFDTVVTDYQMPALDGLQLLQQLRDNAKTRDMPVIILTGVTDRGIKRLALDRGATDLLNKPVDSEDLIARLQNALRLKTYQDQLKRQNELLEFEVRRRTEQLEASRLDIIWRLGKAAEYRDEQTGNHIVRVGYFSRLIAATMGLEKDFTNRLFLAAPLHDIGKIGIPDAILMKPGRLTDDEWCVMRRHCEIGRDILGQPSVLSRVVTHELEDDRASMVAAIDNPVLDLAGSIALTHHEKWDGSGYPNGLSGEDIPCAGRIVAIADVFDALTSDRLYKRAFPEERALEIIRAGAGQHFDAQVYEAFLVCFEEISAIRKQFADKHDAPQPCLLNADAAAIPVDVTC